MPWKLKAVQIGGYVLSVPLLLALGSQPRTISLENSGSLELHGVIAARVQYAGRSAVKLMETSTPDEPTLALVRNFTMRDGTIEADLSGAPASGAGETARGFVGIAFRVQADAKHFEHIYLRPTNGRASDQVRRNHSVQYASYPDFPWERLRKEEPEKYESYVDLQPGVFTHIRIVVAARTAKLYVNGALQPTLVVNDLKLDPRPGGIALWIGPGTEAYFANLSVSTE